MRFFEEFHLGYPRVQKISTTGVMARKINRIDSEFVIFHGEGERQGKRLRLLFNLLVVTMLTILFLTYLLSRQCILA